MSLAAFAARTQMAEDDVEYLVRRGSASEQKQTSQYRPARPLFSSKQRISHPHCSHRSNVSRTRNNLQRRFAPPRRCRSELTRSVSSYSGCINATGICIISVGGELFVVRADLSSFITTPFMSLSAFAVRAAMSVYDVAFLLNSGA